MTDSSTLCQTPVLLLIHRRPELAAQVLAAIRQARPPCILVAADGPAEDDLCRQTRRQVLAGIDWPCEVKTRFLETRAGCRAAVSGALHWAFEQHEELIILEDDCVPHPAFFPFCEAMLERHRDAIEIMQVCGSNHTGMRQGGQSYYFSRFGPVWGWASWRRAWQAYEVGMKSWTEVRDSGELKVLCPETFEAAWRKKTLNDVHEGRLDSWATPWAFARLMHRGLNIIPAVNLVSNIGFGPQATHTFNAQDPRAGLAARDLPKPWVHPEEMKAWREADQAYLAEVVGLPRKIWSMKGLRHILRTLLRR